jgi:integrase
MASIRKRGNNYEYRIMYTDSTGTKNPYSKGGFHTKTAAESAASKIEELIERGGNPFDVDVLFLNYWDEWVATYRTGDVSDITEYRYHLIRKHLNKSFAGRELRSIKPLEWQQFLNKFASGKDRPSKKERSKDMVSKVNGYVRSMVKSAINQQILFSDFTFDAKPRGIEESDKVRFIEADDFAKIKQLAHDQINFSNVSMLAIYVGCMTGMRVSEVCALTWADIDSNRRLIHVKRSWNNRTNRFKPTKTKSSVRDIEVSNEVIEVLRQYHKTQQTAYLKTGYRDENDMVFRTRYHTIISDEAINKTLRSLETDISIPKEDQITFHGLRHSHVSFLISHDVDIYYISKRLGHKDITITMKVYGHLLDKRRKQEADKAVGLLDAL